MMNSTIPAYSPVLNSTLFDLLGESSADLYFFVWDLQADYSHWSDAAVRELGLPSAYIENIQQVWLNRLHPADQAPCANLYQAMLDGKTGDVCSMEFRLQSRSGSYVWMHGRGSLRRDRDGKPELFAGFVKNLGANAKFDATTGLYTAQEFNTQLRDTLGAPGAQGGVLLFGIDGFSHINEAYSYAYGNRVLRALAEQFLALDAPGMLYRMEGDKFAYWQRDAQPSELETMFARFQAAAAALPMEDGTLPLHMTGSYILYPDHGGNVEALSARLEAALIQAKQIRPGALFGYTDAMYRAEEHTRALRSALHRDVENHCLHFELYYQPQIYAKRGGCAAAEAMLRWQHPDFPDAEPSEFVPILEETGDILLVGQWALRAALEQTKQWQSIAPGFGVSLNVSGRQIAQPGFAESVCQLLSRYGLPADTLCLELTESCRTMDQALLAKALDIWTRYGISVALDNFGTGLSGLELLRTMPLKWVKPDRRFIKKLPTSSRDQAILNSMIELAHRLKIHVCVKGIETETQRQYATMAGADFLQGYLFSRPLPAQDFQQKILIPYSQ